jgi:hypothetical protein
MIEFSERSSDHGPRNDRRVVSRYRKQALTVAVLAAVLISLGVMVAWAAPAVKITNCNSASSRPKTLTLTCGDGNTVLSKLRWSSFGGTSAQASGTFEMNTCTPNCAGGKVVRYPVAVKAGNIRKCKAGLRVYNKLSLKFTGRAPKSASSLKNWTLGCPT